jgi:hypothetical protein
VCVCVSLCVCVCEFVCVCVCEFVCVCVCECVVRVGCGQESIEKVRRDSHPR